MVFKLKRINHLIRYFIPFGCLIFFGYWRGVNDYLFLFLIGPVLYLAASLRDAISGYIAAVPFNETLNNFGFLLPLSAAYFGLLGFLFKKLWNERGFIRNLSLVALVGFLVFIHYTAWQNLLGYQTVGV